MLWDKHQRSIWMCSRVRGHSSALESCLMRSGKVEKFLLLLSIRTKNNFLPALIFYVTNLQLSLECWVHTQGPNFLMIKISLIQRNWGIHTVPSSNPSKLQGFLPLHPHILPSFCPSLPLCLTSLSIYLFTYWWSDVFQLRALCLLARHCIT
jgi:hypothetical protein